MPLSVYPKCTNLKYNQQTFINKKNQHQ